MTRTTPQVGDTIATAEELDALPIGTILAAVESEAPAGLDLAVRWPGSWRTDGAPWPIDPSAYIPLTILYLPGHPPRPEREVKAEALRDYARDIRDAAGPDLRTSRLAGTADDIAVALDVRADRIARGDA